MQSRLLIVIVLMMSTMELAAKEPVCGGNFVPCELHSWTDAAGEWRFSLLPHPSGVALSADLVLDKKFTLNGIEELKETIAELPEGTYIVWVEPPGRGTWIKRKETFGYPPERMMYKILWFAEYHKITIATDERTPWVKVPGTPMWQSSATDAKPMSSADSNVGTPGHTQEESPLKVTLGADRHSYRVGDEISGEILLKNTSKAPLYLYAEFDWGMSGSLSLFAREAVTGKDLPSSLIGTALPPPPSSKDQFMKLSPGYIYGVEFTCSLKELGVEKIGTYDLLAWYHSPIPMRYGLGLPIFSREMGSVPANIVTITVVE
jgi:hypothetical protein